MEPKVSVIIPTYQRSEFLQQSVTSILNQTYSEIEIIVVDDNPPDSAAREDTSLAMEIYMDDPRIKYIQNTENMGGALTRNKGIERATGTYITFLDDDDIYLPEKIKRQLTYMLENQLDLSFMDVRIHNSADQLVDFRNHPYVTDLSNKALLRTHIMHNLTPTASYMFKKSTLLHIGGFDDVQMGQEFMLRLKAIEQNLSIGYYPEAHVIQYIHEGERISVGVNKLQKKRELYAFKQQYFSKLKRNEKRYVTFRHHAVMAMASKRSGYYGKTGVHLIRAVLVSPVIALRELVQHMKKLYTYR